jgi:hypothetical protein
VTYIGIALESQRLSGDYTVAASAASVGLFCVAIFILTSVSRRAVS